MSNRLLIFWLACIGVLLIALAASLGMTAHTITGVQSNRWSQTTGVLEWVDTTVDGYILVRYTYRVNGEVFVGNRIAYKVFGSEYSLVELERLRGKAINVFYDPSHPDRATLVKGITSFNYCFLAIPWLLVIAVIFVAYRAVKDDLFREALTNFAQIGRDERL